MASEFSRRLVPAGADRGAPGRDLALEGLRGLCAFSVFYGHATSPIPCLDPVYSPPAALWWLDMGSVAVLVFFVLSGYVIGLTVKETFSGREARAYLGRRLLRLVPVNTAAVLIAWALAPRNPPAMILGNLAFLENINPYLFGWRIEIIPNNPVLWTLNFEMAYYLAFLAVWSAGPRLRTLLLALVAGYLGALVWASFPRFLSCYAGGGFYWFGGLAVAWLAPRDSETGTWPSALLAAAVIWPIAPLWHLLPPLPVHDLYVPPLMPQRLDILPVAAWLVLAVAGRGRRWQRWLAPLSLGLISLALFVRFRSGDFGDIGRPSFVGYAAAIGLAWLLVGWAPRPIVLARLAPLGSISYGLYAVSLALQFGILKVRLLPEGTAGSYALRLAVLVVVAFGTAWLLESKLQPVIRGWFRRPGPAGARPQRA
jgi:peptidoglycan/LPS O-acetylase OafA/YrhL